MCAAVVATMLAGCATPDSKTDADPAAAQADTPAGNADTTAPSRPRSTGYVPVESLEVYYEVHGADRDDEVPLVLLHGGLVTIDLSFGAMLPALARDREVIAIELQGHGHTADRDGPLTYERMADDTAAVLEHLNIDQADFFGFSMGGVTALRLAIDRPDVVRELAVASMAFDTGGYYPGVLDGIAGVKAEDFTGSGLPEAYASVAPNPEDWPGLVEKVKQLDLEFEGLPPEQIASIAAPTLVIVGDSDDVSVAHAARLFELLGGGVAGDHVGRPSSQLAVLPGTTHVGVLTERSDQVLTAVRSFLGTPAQPTS